MDKLIGVIVLIALVLALLILPLWIISIESELYSNPDTAPEISETTKPYGDYRVFASGDSDVIVTLRDSDIFPVYQCGDNEFPQPVLNTDGKWETRLTVDSGTRCQVESGVNLKLAPTEEGGVVQLDAISTLPGWLKIYTVVALLVLALFILALLSS